MATVHNQVWNQYLSIIKADKIHAPRPEERQTAKPLERISDVKASKPTHPVKGRYVDVII